MPNPSESSHPGAESREANNNPNDRHDRHRGDNHGQTYHDSQPDPNPPAHEERCLFFTGIPETKRHAENRALTMAVLVLLSGFLVTFLAIGITAWVWGHAPSEWDGYDHVAVLALSIVTASLLILGILVAFMGGFLSVFWFICWCTGTRPEGQPLYLKTVFILYIILAFIYYFAFLVGIAYFVLLVVYDADQYYLGFWGILLAFIITLMLIGLVWFAKKTCGVRDCNTIKYYDCYKDAFEQQYREVHAHDHHHHHHHRHHHRHGDDHLHEHHRHHGAEAHHDTRPASPESQYRPEDHPEDANYGRNVAREHPY